MQTKTREINIASVSASPISSCLHKLGRSCTTNHLRNFVSGFEGASLAQAAIPPLSGVSGKNALTLPHGQAHGSPFRQHSNKNTDETGKEAWSA